MALSSTQAGTEQIDSLRTELRSWLAEELPDAWRDTGRGTSEEDAVEIRRDWGRRLAEGAWAAPTWPVEIGGRGLSLEGELAIIEELVDAGAPEALNSNGIGIFGEVLRRHGTDAQRRRHLAPMLDHSKIWCQAFSEPNAGSDLASLQTRGIRDGDRLVVNGQKVWTSFARHADYAYALVRSDPDGPKHAGISLVVIEMAHPGVTVRPLRTLVGGWEFAEVFFTDVEVPLDEVVGGLNQGWPLAVEALALERGRSFAERSLKLRREVVNLAALYERLGRSADGVPAEVISSYLDSRRLTSLVTRVLRVLEKGGDATALAALAKLHWSEEHQRLLAAAVEGLEAGVLEPEQAPMGAGVPLLARRDDLRRQFRGAAKRTRALHRPPPRMAAAPRQRVPASEAWEKATHPATHGCCARACRNSSSPSSRPSAGRWRWRELGSSRRCGARSGRQDGSASPAKGTFLGVQGR